jgi:hypothetical protein
MEAPHTGNPTDNLVVAQFAVAALYERRNLLNLAPAVIERRYSKLRHYRQLHSVAVRCTLLIEPAVDNGNL